MPDYEDQLARYQFQMGPARGRLATALDLLTDALALTGQHGIYCRHPSGSPEAATDLRLVMRQIEDSKGLIIEAMQELKAAGER
jgi:hypothetical protein